MKGYLYIHLFIEDAHDNMPFECIFNIFSYSIVTGGRNMVIHLHESLYGIALNKKETANPNGGGGYPYYMLWHTSDTMKIHPHPSSF